MTTEFDSNTFENDYILSILTHFISELKTRKPVDQTLDKYAVELTAFMNGRIVQEVKKLTRTTPDIQPESKQPSIDSCGEK